jgi:ATP-dependent DNA helicase RecG
VSGKPRTCPKYNQPSGDVEALIDALRARGGDTTDVEVKSAGGLPESLTASLSALANLPGDGTVVLGIDERAGFRPVRLADPQLLMQGLAAKARSYLPPVRLTISGETYAGHPIVVARVHECDVSAKPCRVASTVASTGTAYLRGYDGDFELSDLEVQGFLSSRRPPHFDGGLVEGATAADLDPDLVLAFIAAVRDRDPRGLGRFADDRELLLRAGVTLADGRPTVAGLLALGIHPQQFFPRFVIQASAEPRADDPPAVRARNQVTITGAIPRMLDEALAWARRTFDTTIVTLPDGSVHDQPGYPLVAFRELVANALVHRDLDHWSAGLAIEVRLRRDRLVITNPGGLYGITVDRLGKDAVTSARNASLVGICQYVRTPESGSRVIEALASGIPMVNAALAARKLPPAHFIDAGIRFIAIVQHQADGPLATPDLTTTQTRIYEALLSGTRTVGDLESDLSLAGPTIRKALRELSRRDLIQQHGGRGRRTTYSRADVPSTPASPAPRRGPLEAGRIREIVEHPPLVAVEHDGAAL